MALHLTETDVRKLFTMPLALETVETSFRRLADGSAASHPRRRLRMAGKGLLNYMAASDTAGGYVGLKIYTVSPSGVRFLVPLFSGKSGELLALIEADFLGQLRTGAASGIATRFMARQNARTLGIIGTGLQARTQLAAVAAVRKLERVRAFGRDHQRRAKFAQEMTSRVGVPVTAVSSAEEAVRGADILVTSTNSREPVIDGRWLEPGMHINAIGVNFPDKRELDANAVRRCDVIAADSREQSKIESGDLIQVFGENEAEWNRVYDLAQIIAGDVPGRTSGDQITLFKSNGLAIEDIVAAGKIYELARQQGIGKEVPMFEGSA
jgi:alanine dehydrogenase